MKGTFIIARKHGSNEFKIVRDLRHSYREQRAFLKQFRGKRRHPEFAEVYPVKPTGRFRLEPERHKNPEPPKPSLLQRAINALTPAPQPAPARAPQPAPINETETKPKAKPAKKAAAGAFAQRVAAVQAPHG